MWSITTTGQLAPLAIRPERQLGIMVAWITCYFRSQPQWAFEILGGIAKFDLRDDQPSIIARKDIDLPNAITDMYRTPRLLDC